MEFEQGDLVLCTVDRIMGTTVFVKIDSPPSNGEIEGTIITSEIAPGRIRNLREYVVPKKKIVCKILRISGNQINLSLRRVSQKEKKEVLEEAKQEKSYESIFKSILGEKAPEIIKKIKSEDTLYGFVESAKENPKEIEKFLGKENAEKVLEIAGTQKEKKVEVRKTIHLTTTHPDGLEKIKEFLGSKDFEIKYISAGKYHLKKITEDVKKTNQEIKEFLENLEKSSKENHLNFAVLDK